MIDKKNVLLIIYAAAAIYAGAAQAQVAMPAFTPDGGTANTLFSITVSCATAGATITYTTNGIDPVLTDTIIASGSSLTIGRTLTLKARAWLGGSSSAVKTAGYYVAGGIAAGYSHALAVKFDRSQTFAWGLNANNQLGNGNTSTQTVPVTVVTSGSNTAFPDAMTVAGGAAHSLALQYNGGNGAVCAWGKNADGQIGNGTITQQVGV